MISECLVLSSLLNVCISLVMLLKCRLVVGLLNMNRWFVLVGMFCFMCLWVVVWVVCVVLVRKFVSFRCCVLLLESVGIGWLSFMYFRLMLMIGCSMCSMLVLLVNMLVVLFIVSFSILVIDNVWLVCGSFIFRILV